MTDLLIRNLDDETLRRLKDRAQAAGRSDGVILTADTRLAHALTDHGLGSLVQAVAG